MAKICLYAHDWNYIDNYAPVIAFFNAHSIDYDILVLQKSLNDSFEEYLAKYKSQYGEKLIDPYRDSRLVRVIDSLNTIPLIGAIFKTILLLWFMKKLFRKRSYTHLVVSDDRIYNACVAVHSARRARIPNVVMYPVEGIQTMEDSKVTKANVLPRQNSQRKVALRLSKIFYPANTMRFEGKDISFIPPKQAVQLYFFHILPKNPWIRGTNSIDKVAVNSRVQMRENKKYGMHPEKMRVTGFPPYDTLSDLLASRESHQKKIKHALSVSNGKKIFLVLGTHYSDDHRKEDYAKSDRELNIVLSEILESLRDDFTVIFKAHPRMEVADQRNIFTEHVREKVILLKNEYSIYRLISVADAILNFVSASTIAALATDVPIFAYKLTERANFDEDAAIHTSLVLTRNQVELKKNLLLLRNGALYDTKMQKLREDEREKYGMFDGKNTKRFLKMLGL